MFDSSVLTMANGLSEIHERTAGEAVAILAQNSRASPKRLNLTELIRANLVPYYEDRYEFYDWPVKKDITYLPEDDYFDEYEEKDKDDTQQLDRTSRNLLPEYRNLCEIVTRKVELEDSEFEYQPPHYYEVYCKSFSFQGHNQRSKRSTKQKCAHPGFHCVQRSRTLFLLRRRWEGDCWEPFTKEIASGCDCMWPVSSLGDIMPHY